MAQGLHWGLLQHLPLHPHLVLGCWGMLLLVSRVVPPHPLGLGCCCGGNPWLGNHIHGGCNMAAAVVQACTRGRC